MTGRNLRNDVLVGIVTFNRKAKLAVTLDRCEDFGFRNILVVDNCSTDGTRDYLQQRKNVTTIYSEHNIGGSGGFNRIMRHFVENTEYQWLLLFDDDAYPNFHASDLNQFLFNRSEETRPAYALRVTYPDGSLCEMNRPGWNVLKRFPLAHIGSSFHVGEGATACGVDFTSFVGLLLKRETVLKVGFVSPEFFVYSDDTFYTLSISSRLSQLGYCPQFQLIHDCNRSSRRLSNHSAIRVRRDVANKIVLLREYSRYPRLYCSLYLARLVVRNPTSALSIARAAIQGFRADLTQYRNVPAEVREQCADALQAT